MNSNILIILIIFTILGLYDFRRFIRKKEPAKVFIVNIIIMALSLAIGLFLAIGKRPISPSQWIERMLKMTGVIK